MKLSKSQEVARMKKNNELIQEFFFNKKKESYSDKIKKKVGEYKPQDVRQEPGEFGFGGILDLNTNPKTGESFVSVTDPKEAGKRVVSALGASLGVNSVRNMAAKSIKSFPIILSENVDPETSVMLKRVLEEQYAEYISLLISNQIVDISAFSTSEEEGNIAIQALSTVSSSDDEEKITKRKMTIGKVSPEDILGNLTAYNLIRNESKEYKTNNAIVDSLLEGAIVVPEANSKNLIEFYQDFYNEIALLNEQNPQQRETASASARENEKGKTTLDQFFVSNLKNVNLSTATDAKTKREIFDVIRGYEEDSVKVWDQWEAARVRIKDRIKSKEEDIKQLISLVKNPDNTGISKNITELDAKIESLQKEKRLEAIKVPTNVALVKAIESEIAECERDKGTYQLMLMKPSEGLGAIEDAREDKRMLERELSAHEAVEPEKDEVKRGRYRRLTTSDVFLDKEQLRDSLNRSLGEILLDPKNEAVRDKFEKATFLLEANRISGVEYIEYLVQRLGIPVPKDVRQRLVVEYKISDIIDNQNRIRRISNKDIKNIYENRKMSRKYLDSMLKATGKTLLTVALAGAVGAGATFVGQELLKGTLSQTVSAAMSGMATSGASVLAALMPITWLPAVIGVSAAAIGGIVSSFIHQKKIKNQRFEKMLGWERVEALIIAMEEQREDLKKVVVKTKSEKDADLKDYKGEEEVALTGAQITKEIDDYKDYITGILGKAKPNKNETQSLSEFYFEMTPETFERLSESAKIINEAIQSNEDYKTAVLTEAVIQTTIPQTLELKYEYDPKKAPDILAAPKFSQRSQYAYGSVEYDKRELKDRRYNAPLLMKVNFKERFSDGTFSDNELTAVIGILGVITRVPSKEMEYILSSSAEGSTVKGIFEPEGDSKKLISSILGIEKVKKDVENLPRSGDVWQKLEKVSRLAVSNSLAGRRSDNIANAHIVFAQKEIDNVRANEGHDYMKSIDLASSLMKRYSTFTIMIANDISERLYILDDAGNANWDVVPYSAFRNKDTGDQLNAMLTKMSGGRL
jgi:hypothetical protein